MHTIHRAHKVSIEVACSALQQLITNRLLNDLPQDGYVQNCTLEHIEKACVTYVHFASSDPRGGLSTIDGLQAVLYVVVQRSGKVISAKATHAAQTLIWKAAGAGDPKMADRWCRLLRHPVFDGAGHINKAKIAR
jgi:hypothetical protein